MAKGPRPRAAAVRRSVTPYSRFVGLMKIVLPLVAVGLLAAVLIWPSLESRREQAFSYASVEIRSDGLEMLAPVLTGTDDKGHPFTMTAKRATADGLEPTEITLYDIDADLAGQDGKPVKLTAKNGIYRPGDKTVKLDGEVTVTLADGHRILLETVFVDLAKGTASSDKRVEGSGPTGQIEADRMEAADNGHKLRFDGRVRVVITPPAPVSEQPRNGQ